MNLQISRPSMPIPSYKSQIAYHPPSLFQDEKNPLLNDTYTIKTKSLRGGGDIRSHFKNNVRSLLAANYNDVVTDDSNKNGKMVKGSSKIKKSEYFPIQ